MLEQLIIEEIEKNKLTYLDISHQIHANPELGNEEFFASELLRNRLSEQGFAVQVGIPEHETAFIARFASDKPGPKIGFLAEYDALKGLGHACGHNIIGTLSVAAAIALSKVLDQIGGEVVVFGTPAEEGGPNGSAKGTFVRHGLVQDMDACMMIHPYDKTAGTAPTLAVDPIDYEFFGRPAHAAAKPEDGINALDGVIQLYNGINALRQHVTDDVRIHGIILDGGDAANIVPEYARARFFVRASTRKACDEVTAKVNKIAEGAALATGAEVNYARIQNGVDDFNINSAFDTVFRERIVELGEDYHERSEGIGSSDAGNISQVVPTIHPFIKIGESGTSPHTDAFREAAVSEQGDQALITGAKALALTGLDLITKPALLARIKEEFCRG
ncbi:M20 family metallopeptidase [Gracilibacillus caseinilyticus]|uniref:Peptidase M20 domain-containing protein 2 n=1 Tax=Gracilibacillus caseinilyticus TaxID=2932256 RepID=A0ABY4F1U9_9BACI|nr:M20 family metallopeptidase [Gracilibacillus caseinilyticus]UOQ50464.1 M20 family metallopeptidase [Gracilibacillus caseinilyticus]